MKCNKLIIIAIYVAVLMVACKSTENDPVILSAPAGDLFTSINKSGVTVLPNGRLIQPYGKTIEVAPHPFGLALSNDGTVAVTANSGIRPLSISIISNITGEPEVKQVPPGYNNNAGVLESVFMGLAISPDNKVVYVAGGQSNSIEIFDLKTGAKVDSIDCSQLPSGQLVPDGYIGDMVLSKNGNILYAVDQMNFRLVIADVKQKKVVNSVPTGRYPFGLALTDDGSKIYVANVGMFQYSKIGDIESKSDYKHALSFPAFGYNTEEMKNGTTIDSMAVPGLGDPNSEMAFSVWGISVSDIMNAKVVSKIKTGFLVGQKVEGIPAVGGSSPNSLALTSKYLFVSNGSNDNISVIDLQKDTVITDIFIKPDKDVRQFRGVIPFGLTISPDQKKLYVAEAGINAVGVIDIASLKVEGHIPAGWFPSKVKVTPDNKRLIVTNAKGFGSGPNGGMNFKEGPAGTYIGNLMRGSVSVIDIPSSKELKQLSEKVIENNFRKVRMSALPAERLRNPVPVYGGQKDSPIKYIVFIAKENRTYDEVFGQLKEANGDSTIARYGYNETFSDKSGKMKVEKAVVMPNHLRLARQFSFADNFYVDSDVSADGHRWLVNTYPNEWVETCTPASYGGNREYKPASKAPGSLAMNGSAGAIYPEDYNESGSMWDHLERNKVEFYNFGFSVMFEPAFYEDDFKSTGIKQFANFPVPQPLFGRSSRNYATFNMAIPDQYRMTQFINEFNAKWADTSKPMPQVLTVILPNDHGAGERAEAGFPFRESYMADNDLAVGRIVEFLSHTPYWKNMAIFITEDDAQNGIDHVDAHRSICMVVSPYARKGSVSHMHYSFGSIFKTFWNILGLPYLNQYDAGATDLADMFTDRPDFTPYSALPVDIRIFDPAKALTPLDARFDWKAAASSPDLDDPKDMIFDQKEKEEYRTGDQKRK